MSLIQVGQIQFSFFLLNVFIIYKVPFTTDPIEIDQLVPKIQTFEGFQKQQEAKKSYLHCLA